MNFIDLDGSVSGRRRSTVIGTQNSFYYTPGCVKDPKYGLACPHRYVNVEVICHDNNDNCPGGNKLTLYRNNLGRPLSLLFAQPVS